MDRTLNKLKLAFEGNAIFSMGNNVISVFSQSIKTRLNQQPNKVKGTSTLLGCNVDSTELS